MNYPETIYADTDLVCGEEPRETHEKYIRADLVASLNQDLIMARNTIADLLSRLKIASKDAEDNASELTAVESALGFKDFLDTEGKFQNCHQKSLERIRDLIAAVGAIGDLVEIVEGVKCQRWEANGVRLKDTPEWCNLYNATK